MYQATKAGAGLLPNLNRKPSRSDPLNQARLQIALNNSARLLPVVAGRFASGEVGEEEFAEREHATLVHYLTNWIRSGDAVWRSLYLGERAKLAYDPSHEGNARNETIAALVASDRNILQSFDGMADLDGRDRVLSELSEIVERLERPAQLSLDVLFVGDCLHLDTTAFLVDAMSELGIAIRPTYLTQKNPAGLVSAIRELSSKSFDVVFYSPFTYQNGLVSAALYNPAAALRMKMSSEQIAEEMMTEAGAVATALGTTFEAPIFVHNAALVRRHTGGLKDAVAIQATARLRRGVRHHVDARTDILVKKINDETFPHVHKFDEIGFLTAESEMALGRYYHRHGAQHPARLGAVVSERYALILEAVARLKGKKMIVCDLDNTLWDGVIGDGPVQHYGERQALLKKLKDKGILLSIASKNDPRNVHWTDGTLGERDFVYSHINWQPKVSAFPEMERALNLKRKDFVFLDDRADERALVAETYPEIRTFDPDSERTWQLFGIWNEILAEGSDLDRTQMYLDRAARQEMQENAPAEQDRGQLFAKLGLEVSIFPARRGDVKRAAELVNRTNQFNMTAARTTFSEMKSWSEDSSYRIYLASMRDKFGDMGIVSVLAVRFDGETATIPVFVLSCRVFGYDVENVLLNVVKREALARGCSRVTGRHVETMVNDPCRRTYAQNGFTEQDGMWVWTEDSGHQDDPDWLKIRIA